MWFLQNETGTNRRHKGQVTFYVSDFTLHSLAPTVNTEIDEREGRSYEQGGGQEHDGENHRDNRPKLVGAHRLGTDSWGTFRVPN